RNPSQGGLLCRLFSGWPNGGFGEHGRHGAAVAPDERPGTGTGPADARFPHAGLTDWSPRVTTWFFTEESPMLVLSRKVGEGIVVAGGIRRAVRGVGGGQVGGGVAAPGTPRVWREELVGKDLGAPHAFREPPPVRPRR